MKNTLLFLTFLLIVTIPGCKKEYTNGKNSLTKMVAEPAGQNCSAGGFKLSTGLDLNENNILDAEEIRNEEYVCNGDNGENGTNGSNSLINTSLEPSGEFCSFGGLKVESGVDVNNNGVLDESEIRSINYVCNGVDGQSSGEINTIRLPFSLAYKWRLSNTSWATERKDGLLYGFNIEDYRGFDSVIFIAQMFRQPSDSNDTLWLRLYDYTTNIKIENSELFSAVADTELGHPNSRTFKSKDFYNSLYPGSNTLGIQYRSELTGRSISIHHAEIILHKKK